MKKTMFISTLICGLLGAASLAHAGDTIHSFSTDKGRVEVYVGSGSSVYIKTSVNNWDTGFVKGGSSSCAYKKAGSCVSEDSMLSEIENKTRSGAYWR